MKKSSLLSGMEAAAGKQRGAALATPEAVSSPAPVGKDTVMVGAHYPKEVRRALKFLEADTGRKLKPLLAEAINDLCAKYGKPQPCTVEE